MHKQIKDLLLKKANKFFSDIGINYIEIKVPICSDIYCVRRADKQWATYKLGNKIPIVDFGKYNYMWGYDGEYCLVSVYDADRTTFANRGIINEQGEEVVEPYTFQGILNFYGKNESFIIVYIGDKIAKLDKKMLELL